MTDPTTGPTNPDVGPITRAKARARSRVEADAARLRDLSHRLHAHPELAYEEFASSAALVEVLEQGGLDVERGAYGLETAFVATAGTRGPRVVVCAEYDALPEIGHACGHNIIGSSSVGAGLALSGLADELGFRLTVLGTPAEESGGGKIKLIEAGAFEDADVALMVHPAPMEVVDWPTLAWAVVEVTYHGKEAHASMAPFRGVNALDAVTIAYTAVGALRQHILSTERVHGIINHGGDAPNIVPKLTRATYFVRAANRLDLEGLKQRVIRCLEAGAHATGCELELRFPVNDYEPVRTNRALASIYEENLTALGRSALPREAVAAQAGSTDMGNVSEVVPSIHPLMSIDSHPAVNHQAAFAAHTISPAGDRAILDAALAIAWTAIDVVARPDALPRIREEFGNRPPVVPTLEG
jgi:amidohydrolase